MELSHGSPSPLPTPSSATPPPRLATPGAAAHPAQSEGSGGTRDAGDRSDASVGDPTAVASPGASGPEPTAVPKPTYQPRPGEILLPRQTRLSFSRLFRLEEDLSHTSGLADASVNVLEDGRVLVRVPPEADSRVRDFLQLAGFMTEGEE